MSVERTEKALSVFREACELSDDERASFLDAACGEDRELRAEVESMLAWDRCEDDAADESDVPHPIRGMISDLAAPDAETASIPERIGGYRIIRLIARGGMGLVYEARQEKPARRVAIKLARVGGTTTESARRFALEAQLLARLDHPGIAQIIEAGTTRPEAGAQSYFVMQLVEGPSLVDYARAHCLSARKRLELVVRICEAVGFAHRKGVIHRDLKPGNVLVDADGSPRVLDFGVAKVEAAGGFGAATLRTETGRIIGTLGYMAPEQLGGKTEGLGPEADVYSLGVLIYELLTGRLPHELDGVTLTRALAVVTGTDAPLLGVIRPEYRGDIEAVAAKALEKDPRYRYPDAGALQADLERYLRGEPVLARPAGPLLRVAKWTRRNPALATAVFGLFLALVAVAAVLLGMNREVRTALDDYGRLADGRRLEQAIAQADALWPTRAEQAPGLERWLTTYRPLVKRFDEHQAAVDRIRARAGTLAAGSWRFEESSVQWKHDMLVKLVEDLEAFKSDGGLFEQVKERLRLARSIKEETVEARGADWKKAIERIKANPKYGGLTITPRVGLVPLGPDPDSGLEEFLHFETHAGDLPPAGNGERIPLAFDGDTGLVFVLIPGGSFWMGAQSDPDQPDYTEDAWDHERPRHRVDVEMFFLSKYEMTFGQWSRAGGPLLPVMPPEFRKLTAADKMRQPITLVTRDDSAHVMRRLGLILPSEEQWEYAARAGTTTIWPLGNAIEDLNGRANLCGDEAHRAIPKFITDWNKGLEDDHPGIAGVGDGNYPPNHWGLHNVIGNLSEWCANSKYDYASGDPDLHVPGLAVFRGGSFMMRARNARSAMRYVESSTRTLPFVGLRPAARCVTVR